MGSAGSSKMAVKGQALPSRVWYGGAKNGMLRKAVAKYSYPAPNVIASFEVLSEVRKELIG